MWAVIWYAYRHSNLRHTPFRPALAAGGFFGGIWGALLRKYIPESIVEDTFCAKYSKKSPKIKKSKKCMGIKFVGIKNFEIPRNQNAKDTNHKSSCVRPYKQLAVAASAQM